MTGYSKVAWEKMNSNRKQIERATLRVGPLRKNLRTHHERKGGTKALGGKRPLFLRKKRASAIGIGGWSSRQLSPLRRDGPTYKTLKKTPELEFMKRANGLSSGLQRMMDRTLWSGRPPPKS
jgi:hypothetical protein